MTNENLSQYLIDKAKKKKMNDVEIYIEKGESFQVSVRMQEVEEIEEIVSKYGFGRQRTEIDQDMFQRMYVEETKSNK